VAPGRVVHAGPGATFACPELGREVTGIEVDIEHLVNTPTEMGVPVRSRYDHMSRADVQVDHYVMSGDQIGLSGNTGCSLGPHVHFNMTVYAKGRFLLFDPYGWNGQTPDPWAQDPRGTQSFWLWQDGQAPAPYNDRKQAPNIDLAGRPAGNAPVAIYFCTLVCRG
jgi:murein DD-endopeptidase MepM/ murein hydrolase activator NlpD